jgi:hypothetical protein
MTNYTFLDDLIRSNNIQVNHSPLKKIIKMIFLKWELAKKHFNVADYHNYLLQLKKILRKLPTILRIEFIKIPHFNRLSCKK